MLLGATEAKHSRAMQGATAVRRGHHFASRGNRIQVKGTRPSGMPGSTIAKVPGATNDDWDQLVWGSYDPKCEVEEAWI